MKVLITGAAGNLGGKLRRHLEPGHSLRLIDRDPRGDDSIQPADLAEWSSAWVDAFHGVEVVVHLAADPTAQQTWPGVIGPNVDGLVNVYHAAVVAGVRRFVYASSNHVMGGYKDDPAFPLLTVELPPRPGVRYCVESQWRDSTPYGSAKLFGERLGKCLSVSHGLEVIAVRLGWCRAGENLARTIPANREDWFRLMWLSDRDYCQIMERCLTATLPERFTIVNAMSANTGMRWDLAATRAILGYEPQDDVLVSP